MSDINHQEASEWATRILLWSKSSEHTLLAQAYLALQAELQFYRDNCIMLEEGYEPEDLDLVSINNGESANMVKGEEFLEQLKILEPQFIAPLRIIQRQGKPVIIKPKGE